MNVAQSTNKSGFPKWTQPRRWNPFSDFAFDRKYEIRILKSKSRFPNRTQPEIYVLFFFYRSIEKSEKEFEKLSLRTAVLHAHAHK